MRSPGAAKHERVAQSMRTRREFVLAFEKRRRPLLPFRQSEALGSRAICSDQISGFVTEWIRVGSRDPFLAKDTRKEQASLHLPVDRGSVA